MFCKVLKMIRKIPKTFCKIIKIKNVFYPCTQYDR